MAGGYESGDSILTTTTVSTLPDPETEYDIETILAQRGSGIRSEYLVQWAGYPEDSNTWEPYAGVQHCLGEWDIIKRRQAEGPEEIFDVKAWEERVHAAELAKERRKADHKRRRKAKIARRNKKEAQEAAKRAAKRAADSDSDEEADEENEIEDGAELIIKTTGKTRQVTKRLRLTGKSHSSQNAPTESVERQPKKRYIALADQEESDEDPQPASYRQRQRSATARSSIEKTPPISSSRDDSVFKPTQTNGTSITTQTPSRDVPEHQISLSPERALASLQNNNVNTIGTVAANTVQHETSSEDETLASKYMAPQAPSILGPPSQTPSVSQSDLHKATATSSTSRPGPNSSSEPQAITFGQAPKGTASFEQQNLAGIDNARKLSQAGIATSISKTISSTDSSATNQVLPAANLQAAIPGRKSSLSASTPATFASASDPVSRDRVRPPSDLSPKIAKRGSASVTASRSRGRPPGSKLIDNVATGTDSTLFPNKRREWQAQKQGRDQADRAPDPATLQLFDPSRPRPLAKLPSFKKKVPAPTATVAKSEPVDVDDDDDDDDGDIDMEGIPEQVPLVSRPPAYNPSGKSTCYFWDLNQRDPDRNVPCKSGYICRFEHEYRTGMPIAKHPQDSGQSTASATNIPLDKVTCFFWHRGLLRLDFKGCVNTSEQCSFLHDYQSGGRVAAPPASWIEPSEDPVRHHDTVMDGAHPDELSEYVNVGSHQSLSLATTNPVSSNIFSGGNQSLATSVNPTLGNSGTTVHGILQRPAIPQRSGENQSATSIPSIPTPAEQMCLKQICPWMRADGTCSARSNCIYFHGRPQWNPQDPKNAICHYWVANRTCSRGDDCEFKHSDDIRLAFAPSPREQTKIRRNLVNRRHEQDLVSEQSRSEEREGLIADLPSSKAHDLAPASRPADHEHSVGSVASTSDSARPAWDPYRPKRGICHFWFKDRNCTKGVSCLYPHYDDPTLPVMPSVSEQRRILQEQRVICIHLLNEGHCPLHYCSHYHPLDGSAELEAARSRNDGATTTVSSRPQWDPQAPWDAICPWWKESGACRHSDTCWLKHEDVPQLPIAPFGVNDIVRSNYEANLAGAAPGPWNQHPKPLNPNFIAVETSMREPDSDLDKYPYIQPPPGPFAPPAIGARPRGPILATSEGSATGSRRSSAAGGGRRRSVRFLTDGELPSSQAAHEDADLRRGQWLTRPDSPPPFGAINDHSTSVEMPDEAAEDAPLVAPLIAGLKPLGDAVRRIGLADYVRKKATSPPNLKVVSFGSASTKSAVMDFGKIDAADDNTWKMEFLATTKIVFNRICLGYHLKISGVQNIMTSKLWLANVQPADLTDADAILFMEQAAKNLSNRVAGLRADFGSFSILIYPIQGLRKEWDCVDSCKGATNDTLFRYCIFEPLSDNNQVSPQIPRPMKALRGSEYETMLREKLYCSTVEPIFRPIVEVNGQRQHQEPTDFFLFVAPSASQVAIALAAFVRSHQPNATIYTSLLEGSWHAFTRLAKKAGVALIHESAISELPRLDGLRHLLYAKKPTLITLPYIWFVSHSTTPYPLYPSIQIDPQLRDTTHAITATRLFTHGYAICLTPSFLVAEPEKTAQLLDWYLFGPNDTPQWVKSPYKRLVTCHDFAGYLLDLAQSKAAEKKRNDDHWKDNPRREAELEHRGLGFSTCNNRFKLYGALIIEEQKISAGLIPLASKLCSENETSPIVAAPADIGPDDEPKLLEWFAWWSTKKFDRYKNFVVVGTSKNTQPKRLRRITRKEASRPTTPVKQNGCHGFEDSSTIKYEAPPPLEQPSPSKAQTPAAVMSPQQKALQIAARYKNLSATPALTSTTNQPSASIIEADRFLDNLALQEHVRPERSSPEKQATADTLIDTNRPAVAFSMSHNKLPPLQRPQSRHGSVERPSSSASNASDSEVASPTRMDVDNDAISTNMHTKSAGVGKKGPMQPEWTQLKFTPTTEWYEARKAKGEGWEHVLVGDLKTVAPTIGFKV